MWDEGREPERPARRRRVRMPADVLLTCVVLACVATDAVVSFVQGPFAQVLEFASAPLTLLLMLVAAVTILLRRSNGRSPWIRPVLLLAVIGIPYGYVKSGAMYELQHIGLRRYVTSRVNLSELQAAALELIDANRASTEIRRYGPLFTESHKVPAVIRRLKPFRVVVFPQPTGAGPAHVLVGWGAAFTTPFGVLLGPPEYRPDDEDTRQWAPGIYGEYSRTR